ncbi:unnamed protein product [Toxocara canis]|uniref:AsnC_trans_reg domain-containing protein n=1 Tax=Toxocara canis TaxID=6265 RepID=A0A183VG04_TOXCA|nr:unnamed protein product [Toxocara canis]
MVGTPRCALYGFRNFAVVEGALWRRGPAVDGSRLERYRCISDPLKFGFSMFLHDDARAILCIQQLVEIAHLTLGSLPVRAVLSLTIGDVPEAEPKPD